MTVRPKRITFEISDQLHANVKLAASALGLNQSEFVQNALFEKTQRAAAEVAALNSSFQDAVQKMKSV